MTHKQRLKAIITNLSLAGHDKETLQDIFCMFLDESEDTAPDNAYRLAISELEDIFGLAAVETATN